MMLAGQATKAKNARAVFRDVFVYAAPVRVLTVDTRCLFIFFCDIMKFFFASSPFLNGIEWDPNFILKRYRKKFSRGKFA